MGRELMRVPPGFYWPIGKVWKGYLRPPNRETPRNCQACGGSGNTALYRHLHAQWYGNVYFTPSMTGSVPFGYEHPAVQEFSRRQIERSPDYYGTGQDAIDRNAERLANLWDRMWMHHLDADDVAALLADGRLSDLTRNGVANPTPEQVNEWSLWGFGHDAINCWICIRAKLRRMGEGDGKCIVCHGHGEIWPSRKARRREWKPFDPPKGPCFQVWETVSEGSPISPVFRKPEQVVAWLMKNGYSRKAAEGFVGAGWVPSMMTQGGRLYRDIEACGVRA